MDTSGGRSHGRETLASLKHKALPPRPRAVLEAVLATASSMLEMGLAAALNDLEQQLFKLAEQARSNDAQNKCFEALREIRRGRADVVPRFMLRLEAALANIGEEQAAPQFARMGRDKRNELSLLDPSELEESLALQEIASKAEIRNTQALFSLGQRFGVLGGLPAFDADELPVGPYRLCECLREASACLDLGIEYRVLLYRTFDRQCLALAGALYDQLNELGVRMRVLPNLQLQARVKKAATPAPDARGATTPPNGNGGNEAKPGGEHNAPPRGERPQLRVLQGGAGAPREVPPAKPLEAELEPPHHAPDMAPRGFGNPMTGWPSAAHYPADRAGEPDARDAELFDTMRSLLSGRRRALGVADVPAGSNTHTAKPNDLQAVLGAIQAKPAPPAIVGGKAVPRSMTHLKQDVLSQLRQITPDGKTPRLAEPDGDTMDLVGMLFEHLGKDARPGSTVQDLLTKLQIPLLRVALKDKSFFTRRGHPARQLLNAIAEAGLFWLDDDGEDEALVERMRLVVDRAAHEYDDNPELFEDLLGDLSRHLGTLAKKSEVAERRHVDAARGREKLELSRAAATEAIARVLRNRKVSALTRTLLEQAWTDVLALTLLRQGEESEAYHRRVAVAERVVQSLASGDPSRNDPTENAALRREVEGGLAQVGYHADDVRTVVDRLFGVPGSTTADEPTSLTELAMKLKSRARLGEMPGDAGDGGKPAAATGAGMRAGAASTATKPATDTTVAPTASAGADADAASAAAAHQAAAANTVEQAATGVPAGRSRIHPPLAADELRVLERLKSVPFGTWFEFVANQQGDKVRRKLSWFSTVTGRCLFVNQRGARTEEKTLEQLARDIARGHASVVEAQKESLIDRAWNAIMATLSKFSAPKPAPTVTT